MNIEHSAARSIGRKRRPKAEKVGLPGVEAARVEYARSGDQLQIRPIEAGAGEETAMDQLKNLLHEEFRMQGFAVEPESIDPDHFPTDAQGYYIFPESVCDQIEGELEAYGFSTHKGATGTFMEATFGDEKVVFIFSPEEGEKPDSDSFESEEEES